MNNRLNMQDMARLLCEHTGRDREAVELFLKEFVGVVTEGVYTDKLVKVKGLGTFKIIPVEKRESIHVNTGERFLIPEHYKFSFLPDKELREQVNKPFSFFETTEINEHVNFSDMDVSEEEKDTEDESVEEVMPEREMSLIDIAPKPGADELSEPVPEIVPEPELKPELESAPESLPEPEPEKIPEAGLELPPEVVRPVSRKSIGTGGYLGIVAVTLILISSAIIYIGKDRWLSAPVSRVVVQARDTIQLTPDSMEVRSQLVDSTSYEVPKSNVLDSVKISSGDRLTMIALKYYGHKLFWVYLYQHNKARIKDPNNVPIGTIVEIPAPELYGIDSNSRESRDKAAALQTEILTGE